MSLPYDPHSEEAVTIAPLIKALIKRPGAVGHCSKCGDHVWINKETGEFAAKNEVQILCPLCAIKFQEGEI